MRKKNIRELFPPKNGDVYQRTPAYNVSIDDHAQMFSSKNLEDIINEVGNVVGDIDQLLNEVNGVVTDIGLATTELNSVVEGIRQPRWNDIVFELTPTRVNPTTNKPDYSQARIGFLFPQNDATEIITITVQLPHSWKEGTVIYPHVHVQQERGVQQPVFKMDYIWYNAGDTIPSVWQTYVMGTYALPYTSGVISNIVRGDGIGGTGKEISSLIKIRLYRDDNSYVGDILADQFDIHIQIDAFGSSSQYEK